MAVVGVIAGIRLGSGSGASADKGGIPASGEKTAGDRTTAPDEAEGVATEVAVSPGHFLGKDLGERVQLVQFYGTGQGDLALAELVAGPLDGSAPKTGHWLRGVAGSTGQILWTVDVAQFGLADTTLYTADDPSASRLALAINSSVFDQDQSAQTDTYAAGPAALAMVDTKTGQVLSTGQLHCPARPIEHACARPYALTDSTLVVVALTGPNDSWEVLAFSVDDLATPQWTAPFFDTGAVLYWVSEVVGDWFPTRDGLVNLKDGSPAPWGQDQSSQAVLESVSPAEPLIYYFAAQDGAVFRATATDLAPETCQLWDIATDQALWPAPVACNGIGAVLPGNGVYFISDRARAPHLRTVSADDGRLVWEEADCWPRHVFGDNLMVGCLPNGSVGFDDGPGKLLDAATGQTLIEEIAQPPLAVGIGPLGAAGSRVFYTETIDPPKTVHAWQLSDPLPEPLWRLQIPDGTRLRIVADRLVIVDFAHANLWLVQEP